ncbi:hypothetical protein [uncultured Ruegeria sp.]|uniref:hypothetical protein n=1 Tax=uncultured Ruegeria sp. TaxID=259304 RepID=UPI0026326315|nr:hypothetical protein [uncultured Ruegeria sp.]
MRKLALVFLLLVAVAAGGLWFLRGGPLPYVPSDLSDLYQNPDSPVRVTDVSALEEAIVIDATCQLSFVMAHAYRPMSSDPYHLVHSPS